MTRTAIPDLSALHRAAGDPARTSAEAEVLRQLRGIRFGQVSIQIHDARIVQIERTEKIRVESRPEPQR
jgi:hypothetical protein